MRVKIPMVKNGGREKIKGERVYSEKEISKQLSESTKKLDEKFKGKRKNRPKSKKIKSL